MANGAPVNTALPPVSPKDVAAACAAEQELAKVLTPAAKPLQFGAGERLFAAGDDARGVYLVARGSARAWLPGRPGEALVSRVAGPGAVLGLHAALCSSRHQFEVEAASAVEVLFVETAQFHEALRDHPLLCMQLMQMMCDELDALGERREHMKSCTNRACSLHGACTGGGCGLPAEG
jgi:CRP-like cAMP-binding protein